MNESTSEFGIREYVHAFEKSLDYMTAVILSIVTAVICSVSQSGDWKMGVKHLVQQYSHEPKEIFYIVVAVLVTLPNYFYYTLKDDVNWNTYGGEKDSFGLKKIFIFIKNRDKHKDFRISKIIEFIAMVAPWSRNLQRAI